MQQQQLAAQLANHGSGRAVPLSPPMHTSDSDSDISLGTHSPPLGSPNPLRYSSPTPLSTFRFGPHSPGPMPAQFRFGYHSPPGNRLDRHSPSNENIRKLDNNIDNSTSNYRANLRLGVNEQAINVNSLTDYRSSKNRNLESPPQTSLQPSPPINLRVNNSDSSGVRLHPDSTIPLHLSATTPLRIQVSLPNKITSSSPQTNLHMGDMSHGISGIVRIAHPNHANPPTLHRPFSPRRLS